MQQFVSVNLLQTLELCQNSKRLSNLSTGENGTSSGQLKIKDLVLVISLSLPLVLQNQPTLLRLASCLIYQNSSWLIVTHKALVARVVTQQHLALYFLHKEQSKRVIIPTQANKTNARVKTPNLFSNFNTLEVNRSANQKIHSKKLSDRALSA